MLDSFLGGGFSYPLIQDDDKRTIKAVGGEEKIRQSIYVILMTKVGERPLRPDFGSRIHEYVYELPGETVMALLCNEVVQSVYKWEHRVEDVTASADTSEIMHGRVFISVSYTVRATNRPDNLVFPFYLEESRW